MDRQWFLSDLHLAEERPDTLALFSRFLDVLPTPGDAVYILGDLFDVWIGDDDDSPLAQRVKTELRRLTRHGVSLYLQRGNRDFAIGRRLADDTGARLLPDAHVVEVAGEPTLLMHGDLLCTDDTEYLKARRRFRNPLFQWFMLRKPLAERRRLAAHIQQRSRQRKALKADYVMDVNDDAVVRYLLRHRVRRLIHGHTHRPARHWLTLPDGQRAERLVLPEWHDSQVQVWTADHDRLRPVTLDTR